MHTICPHCSGPYLAEDINVQTNLALCRGCGQVAQLSKLTRGNEVAPLQMPVPPSGAWHRQTMFDEVIGATTRHPMAFILVPFLFVWSGGSLGGIYGRQIATGQFNLMQSLFGLPFLTGSIALGCLTLLAIFGKVEAHVRGREIRLFVGVRSVGWKRTLNLDDIDSITEDRRFTRARRRSSTSILLQGRATARFGSMLSPERRAFLVDALRAVRARK